MLESLKDRTNTKKRYAAMEKYFSYRTGRREVCRKPCPIDFEGKQYTSFTNSWSLVLTTEPTGEIDIYDTSNGDYPLVGRLINFDGIKKKIDFAKVKAEAKSKGYKLTKTEVGEGCTYLMLYDETHYSVGLIDISFGIIDDGKPAMTYHPAGEKKPLTIQNDIGICVIMPIFFHGWEPDESRVVIEVK